MLYAAMFQEWNALLETTGLGLQPRSSGMCACLCCRVDQQAVLIASSTHVFAARKFASPATGQVLWDACNAGSSFHAEQSIILHLFAAQWLPQAESSMMSRGSVNQAVILSADQSARQPVNK
jgi:hypothetical protein